LCKRVIIINSGEKIYDGELDKLILSAGNYKNIHCVFSSKVETKDLKEYGKVIEYNDMSATLRIKQDTLKVIIPKLLGALPIADLSITSPEARDVIATLYEKSLK